MEKRNHFTQKFSTKSNQELRAIIKSPDYVDQAKLAAQWILEKRDEQKDNPEPKHEGEKNESWVTEQSQDPERRRMYLWRILGFGVVCIISAILLNYQHIITTKNSLTELKGTIQSTKVVIGNASTIGRWGQEIKSRKATLYFRLKLVENIGQDYSHEEYQRISKYLKNSKIVTVWINQSELNSNQPKIFQIDVNESTILDFNTVRTEYAAISIFLLVLGICSIGFPLYREYSERIHFIYDKINL